MTSADLKLLHESQNKCAERIMMKRESNEWADVLTRFFARK